ncbi:DUF969 family protein [candidate division KSB1 bacterium]|nr:DUF969 family protein [candidate division KSB1 bacterium]
MTSLVTAGGFAASSFNTVTLLVCLLALFYVTESLERDLSTRLHAIAFATPVRTAALLTGKCLANSFVGAVVVVVAALTAGACAGMSVIGMLELIGDAFLNARFLLLFALTLPVIGLLERHGLREHAQRVVLRLRGATASRLLIVYLFLRQLGAALGLTGKKLILSRCCTGAVNSAEALAFSPKVFPSSSVAGEITHTAWPLCRSAVTISRT